MDLLPASAADPPLFRRGGVGLWLTRATLLRSLAAFSHGAATECGPT
jgi:hypothetical protein